MTPLLPVPPARLSLFFLLAAIAAAPAAEDPSLVAPTGPLSPAEEQAKLKLPPGFEIQLVASEPAIHKPMNLACDERGRLWVTDTIEYPFPAKEGVEPRDSVKILEDADGDGRAEKVTTFARGLNIPIGVLPIPGGALVFGIPRVWKLIDHDGDDRADEKTEFLGTFEFRDTHGMTSSFTWGMDGWIYACHGYSNTSDIRAPGGATIRLNSGNTYRFTLDGARLEQFTHGQVNPFGLSFDALGNLYSADCHSQPVYMLLHHAYYPSFGKPHDGLGFGPDMIDHDHGSTGICGIVYYAAEQFPPEYRDTVFIGNPVTRRVNHDRLERRGSTLWTVHRPDFIDSDDPWFRPVDLELAPDGTMYIADFYNKIIGHYEVPLTHPGRDRERGRIWRVVYRGSGGNAPPPGKRAIAENVAGLIEDLAAPSLAMRTLAANAIVRRGGDEAVRAAAAAVAAPRNVHQEVHALWVLERLGALDEKLLAAAAADPEPAVRLQAQRVLEGRSGLAPGERRLSLAALADPDAFVARAAAQALGAHPLAEDLPGLLELRRRIPAADTHLLYAVRLALRDHLLAPDVIRVASGWDLLGGDAALAADVARGAATPEAARFLLSYATARSSKREGAPAVGGGELAVTVEYLARNLDAGDLKQLEALARAAAEGSPDLGGALLEGLGRGFAARGAQLDEALIRWADELAGKLLASDRGAHVLKGIEIARAFKLTARAGAIAGSLKTRTMSEEARRAACDALVALRPDEAPEALGGILRDPAELTSVALHVANALGDIDRPAAVEALRVALRAAPAKLAFAVAAALAKRPAGCEGLLADVESGKASPRLLQDRRVETRIRQTDRKDLAERRETLLAGLPEADERVEGLLEARRTGYRKAEAEGAADVARGAAVFEKTCAPCHRIASRGSKIGPDLDGIGARGLERLLEDTLDPSRVVDQAFRSTVILGADGVVRTGLFLREEGQLLVLADGEGKTFSVSRAEVKSQETSSLSPMPANLFETLPEKDFYDLLAFLFAAKP